MNRKVLSWFVTSHCVIFVWSFHVVIGSLILSRRSIVALIAARPTISVNSDICSRATIPIAPDTHQLRALGFVGSTLLPVRVFASAPLIQAPGGERVLTTRSISFTKSSRFCLVSSTTSIPRYLRLTLSVAITIIGVTSTALYRSPTIIVLVIVR